MQCSGPTSSDYRCTSCLVGIHLLFGFGEMIGQNSERKGRKWSDSTYYDIMLFTLPRATVY